MDETHLEKPGISPGLCGVLLIAISVGISFWVVTGYKVLEAVVNALRGGS